MCFRRLVYAVCCALVPAGSVSAGSDVNFLDPPQGLFSDEWMVLQGEGEKVGYSNTTLSRQGDLITSRTVTVMKIGRGDQVIEITVIDSKLETVSGEPREFDTVSKMGVIGLRTWGYIEGGTAHIRSTQFGAETELEATYPEGAVMSWGLFRTQVEKGFKPGTKYDVHIYEPQISTSGALRLAVSVEERTKIDLLGKEREAVKVVSQMSTPKGQVDSVTYVDDSGIPLKLEVDVALMTVTMTATDKQTALADFEPPELFLQTLVKVDRAIDTKKARSIRYALSVSGERRKLPQLPDTSMQKVLEQEAQSAKLVVTRLDHEALKKAEPASKPQAKMAEFLKASPMLNFKDEAVTKMAAAAAGDEKRPYQLADRLRRYVGETIKEKNLSIGFATAGEVCRQREGDCTEHAVLLAALGRARGLPSRVVIGLVYVPQVGDQQNVFGFHMWTQFFIGGKWVDFDAAMNESDCSPAHIALGTSPLNDVGLGDLAFAVIDVIARLEIEIEEIQLPQPEAEEERPSEQEG